MGISDGNLPQMVICYIAIVAMAIEIVDLPSYEMVIFHSYVKVYQRFKGRLTAPTALPPGDGLLHGSHGHSLADEVGG
jgi:hypothetical protein